MSSLNQARTRREIIEDALAAGQYSRVERELRKTWLPLTADEWRVALGWVQSAVFDDWRDEVGNAHGLEREKGYMRWLEGTVQPLWNILRQLAEHRICLFEPLGDLPRDGVENHVDWASGFLRGMMTAGRSMSVQHPRGWTEQETHVLIRLGLSNELLRAISEREYKNTERDAYFAQCRQVLRSATATRAERAVHVKRPIGKRSGL